MNQSAKRPIPDWPGYRISNRGALESCRTNGGKTGTKWRRRRPHHDKDGYWCLKLHGSKGEMYTGIHVLVLLVFGSEKPSEYHLALHKNGNRRDNRINNLYWGTAQDNADDRERHGNTARYELNGNAKTNWDTVGKIRRLRASTGISYGKIAKRFGMSKRQIMRICKLESWNPTR